MSGLAALKERLSGNPEAEEDTGKAWEDDFS